MGMGKKAVISDNEKSVPTISNTITEEGYSVDGRQLNPNIEGTLANKVENTAELLLSAPGTIAEYDLVFPEGKTANSYKYFMVILKGNWNQDAILQYPTCMLTSEYCDKINLSAYWATGDTYIATIIQLSTTKFNFINVSKVSSWTITSFNIYGIN